MAVGLFSAVVFVVCVTLAPLAFAGDRDCQSYIDLSNVYHPSQSCRIGFCCGTCKNRYCCQDSFWRLSEDKQDLCESSYIVSPLPMVFGIGAVVVIVLIFICCCVCPCCCLYKMCRKPQPVVATTTHTTVVTTNPQQYPRQPPVATGPPQAYQGPQYPNYQPIPVQPGYGNHPVPQGYGTNHMPTPAFHGQPYTAGPPPTYQEATGPAFHPTPMPYSQAAFTPGQPAYSPQFPVQANAPPAPPHTDYLAQPAYNPNYVSPPPKAE
ncbi:protein shisa-5-like [Thalassophryne amazonica]|uniref:protein shisa-5-like n=1 Tax=Thalassophryne amazonica TaxID=390379 RepID=UPI001470DB53|nr:protein shisa-5-like [Thalassophryne amazonica]